MKVFYTLKGNIYNACDVELALQCAENAFNKYGWPVRALIETLQQKNIFDGVNGFSWSSRSQFRYNKMTGELTTRRQFQGGAGEIIVAVCPTLRLLQALQQNTANIKLLIVVPEMDQEACIDVFHWLDLYSATDIESHAIMNGIGQPAIVIKRAIGFLIGYCQRMNVDVAHTPLYTGEIADVANTLKEHGIIANYEEVVKYCLTKGLSYRESEILAKAFSQRTHIKMRGKPDYDKYWQSINDPKWE